MKDPKKHFIILILIIGITSPCNPPSLSQVGQYSKSNKVHDQSKASYDLGHDMIQGADEPCQQATTGSTSKLPQEIKASDMEPSSLLNFRGPDKVTPLHQAICFGHRESARWLVSHGASVYVVDAHGRNVLHCCAEVGDCELTELFLSEAHGVNAFQLDRKAQSPLMTALLGHHVKLGLVYLKRGLWLTQEQLLSVLGARQGRERAHVALVMKQCLEPQFSQLTKVSLLLMEDGDDNLGENTVLQGKASKRKQRKKKKEHKQNAP